MYIHIYICMLLMTAHTTDSSQSQQPCSRIASRARSQQHAGTTIQEEQRARSAVRSHGGNEEL